MNESSNQETVFQLKKTSRQLRHIPFYPFKTFKYISEESSLKSNVKFPDILKQSLPSF